MSGNRSIQQHLLPWFVYMVRCSDGTLYTGITTDLSRRLHEHNSATRGARYTRGRRPVMLVYREEVTDRSLALSREYQLKRLSRKQKERLITTVAGRTHPVGRER